MSARLLVFEGGAAVAEAAASHVAGVIAEAVAARGVAHVALAGGTTPRAAYEALAGRALPWSAVHLWFGDERAVPPDHEASNHAMARAAFAAARLPDGNVHAMFPAALAAAHADLTAPAALAAARDAYEAALPRALDLVLLGLGPDAHLASLFPGGEALASTSGARVAIVRGAPKPPPDRLTLTPAALAAARATALIVVGAEKAAALAASLAPGADPRATPGALAAGGTVLADEAAASHLPRPLAKETSP